MYIELQGMARVVIRIEKPDKVYDKILFKKSKCYFYIHTCIYIYITNSCLMSVCVCVCVYKKTVITVITNLNKYFSG